jgi:hypothetical protein
VVFLQKPQGRPEAVKTLIIDHCIELALILSKALVFDNSDNFVLSSLCQIHEKKSDWILPSLFALMNAVQTFIAQGIFGRLAFSFRIDLLAFSSV